MSRKTGFGHVREMKTNSRVRVTSAGFHFICDYFLQVIQKFSTIEVTELAVW